MCSREGVQRREVDRPGRYMEGRGAIAPATVLDTGRWKGARHHGRAQVLSESAWVAEVCEGSVQGRQVWTGRCQAFLEHPVRCILWEVGPRI